MRTPYGVMPSSARADLKALPVQHAMYLNLPAMNPYDVQVQLYSQAQQATMLTGTHQVRAAQHKCIH